jgi:transposase-like protein
VIEGLRGEKSIASPCHHEDIAANLYYRWSKEFLEAGKKAESAQEIDYSGVTAGADAGGPWDTSVESRLSPSPYTGP